MATTTEGHKHFIYSFVETIIGLLFDFSTEISYNYQRKDAL